MNELFIKKVRIWVEPEDDDGAALAALAEVFGKRVTRRMTRLGMMVSAVLKDMSVTADSSIVYATIYAETCAIEKFLRSFPYPSPQLFQTSIHPSAVEQYLIQNRQPVREFFPLAGERTLLPRALDCVRLCTGETRILCGGEERGTWLRGTGISSELNYAWALELSTDSAAAVGVIRWADDGGLCDYEDMVPQFLEALEQQDPLRIGDSEDRYLELSWSE